MVRLVQNATSSTYHEKRKYRKGENKHAYVCLLLNDMALQKAIHSNKEKKNNIKARNCNGFIFMIFKHLVVFIYEAHTIAFTGHERKTSSVFLKNNDKSYELKLIYFYEFQTFSRIYLWISYCHFYWPRKRTSSAILLSLCRSSITILNNSAKCWIVLFLFLKLLFRHLCDFPVSSSFKAVK